MRRKTRPESERPILATSRTEIDTRLGFGRGSAVREYWLERCQGFYAVRADGRRLGRVKRVETQIEGSFLLLTGFRARTIPLSAVEKVWPGASLLLVSEHQVEERSEAGLVRAPVRTRPAWMDETLPWWELVGDESPTTHHPIAGPVESQRQLTTRRASFHSMMTTLANTVAPQAKGQIERLRKSALLFRRNAERAGAKTLRVVNRARTRALGTIATNTSRTRLRVARWLFGIAVWVGGNRECLLGAARENRGRAADEADDTEEIG
jgi:hypothetical protein